MTEVPLDLSTQPNDAYFKQVFSQPQAAEFFQRPLPGELLRLTQTMSIAQQLIAGGKSEGKAEGKGEGKLQLLQELMGLPITSAEELAGTSVEEVEARIRVLQAEYEARFKNRQGD